MGVSLLSDIRLGLKQKESHEEQVMIRRSRTVAVCETSEKPLKALTVCVKCELNTTYIYVMSTKELGPL